MPALKQNCIGQHTARDSQKPQGLQLYTNTQKRHSKWARTCILYMYSGFKQPEGQQSCMHADEPTPQQLRGR